MFKTAATKIAHNSTLPALAGNQDLRPLQDLITAEKTVLISLQKLSVDYSKAAEALRTWGLNEGDDLGDILTASTTLLNLFSAALSQYAAHGHVMRDQLKSIRTKEEGLDELKRRRRTLMRKAEDADKKLSKMNPEHKNLSMQTDLLNRLRDEIRLMDSDIMSEEAALGDFKRTASRMWIGLKFGGLLECCEKGTILAEFGKMVVSEIPEDITQPGLPRSLYYGHSKTEGFVSEASQRVNEVTLSDVPTVGFRDRRQYDVSQQNLQQSGYHLPVEGPGMEPGPWTPTDNKPQPLPPPMEDQYMSNLQRPYGTPDAPRSPATSVGGSFANYPQHQSYGSGSGYDSRTMPLPSQSPPTVDTIDQHKNFDDFGVNTRSGPIDNSNTAGGRFATFPVKTRPPGMTGGYSLHDPPSLNARHDQEKSLSASIAEALGSANQESSKATEVGTPEMISPGWGRVNDNENKNPNAPTQAWSELHADTLPTTPAPAALEVTTQPPLALVDSTSTTSLPPPPPGAAAPDLSDPWANEGSLQAPSHTRSISQISHDDDALLAYMTAAPEESRTTDEEGDVSRSRIDSSSGALKAGHPVSYEEQQRISRHVRFGEVQDVEGAMENRRSLEKERQLPDVKKLSPLETIRNSNEGERGLAPVSSQKATDGEISPTSDFGRRKQHRISPPEYKPEEHDEVALNAAVAREITRELEALNVNQSNPPDVNHQSQTEPIAERGRLPTTSRGYPADNEADNLPLAPPSAPFAARTVSPHPYADLNKNAPYGSQPSYSPPGSYGQTYQNSSSPYSSQANVTPAQAYAQSYQSSTSYSQPQTPEAHAPSSTLPPRFQAMNQSMESQVPPRFQGSGSPMSSPLPPRFQATGSSQIPPAISLPEQKGITSESGTESAYHTPLEYPRPLGASPSYTRSNTSLSTASSPVVPPGSPAPSGARTISAAAFKRPRNASTDAPGDPFRKKSLPSSPYPTRDPSGVHPPPPPAAPVEQIEEDDYDYVSAYLNNSNPNSPQRTSFDGHGQGPLGRPSGGGGYSDGRFATNLENGSLR